MQNHKKSKCDIVKECSYVITGFMPGIAAYRVAVGKKQRAEELVDPKTELVIVKAIEMFAEGSKF